MLPETWFDNRVETILKLHLNILRTEVKGDFNIPGTEYFQDAVFHQKSKIYDVVSLLYLWLAKKPVLYMKY